MINRFLEKTKAGELTVGMFFEMGHAAVAEIAGMSDMDYFIIDCEHSPYDVESAAEVIRSAEGISGCKVTPLVRSRDSSRTSILKLLDIGAKGVVVPNVSSLEEAKRIVSYGKYFPVGNRGVAVTRSVQYGFGEETTGTMLDWFAESNEKELLIPQCETLGCLAKIEEIAALDGIDGIFVGPYDLSTALGLPGQFKNDTFIHALKRILKAVKAQGKFAMIYVEDFETAAERAQMGYDSITFGMDTSIYFHALNRVAANVRHRCQKK